MSNGQKIICDPIFYKDLKHWLSNEANITTFKSEISEDTFDYLYQYKSENHVVMLFNSTKYEGVNIPIKDHINLSYNNPLIGKHDSEKGNRFPDMSNVYSFDPNEKSVVITMGDTAQIKEYDPSIITVKSGVYEAIVLAHAGIKIKAWLIGNLADFYQEKLDNQ